MQKQYCGTLSLMVRKCSAARSFSRLTHNNNELRTKLQEKVSALIIKSENFQVIVARYHLWLKKMLSHYTAQRRLEETRYSSYSFSTSALDGVSGQSHAPPALYPWERTPGTHCAGGWMGPRAVLDTEVREKILLPLPGIELDGPVVQALARHYTDSATQLTHQWLCSRKIKTKKVPIFK
jgi:hypothetical protein